jgi:hypothetical protein
MGLGCGHRYTGGASECRTPSEKIGSGVKSSILGPLRGVQGYITVGASRKWVRVFSSYQSTRRFDGKKHNRKRSLKMDQRRGRSN